MNFRTVDDLFGCVRRHLHRLPRDIDLIVGVPRSGVLAACAVSLALHRPLTDLNSFLEGRTYSGFSHRKGVDAPRATTYRSVLVVDDSIYAGNSMRKVRDAVVSSGRCQRVRYVAVYGLNTSHPDADIILEACPAPRAFEWNIMNHVVLQYSCVDLDGVLCMDPTPEQNDDGSNYMDFIRNAELLNAPSYRINSIVTSRLEKYRRETEKWLSRNGIDFDNLFMLDLASAEERRRLGLHAKFKAQIFKSRSDCLLFIESDLHQANFIRDMTGKSVLAYGDMQFLPEGIGTVIKKRLRQRVGGILPHWLRAPLKATLGIR